MAKAGRELPALIAEIERQANAKVDYIAPASQLMMHPYRADAEHPGPVVQIVDHGIFDMRPLAHEQMAEYTGVPLAYYRRMMAEQPELLARNVNTWLQQSAAKGERRMVRTIDGQARAVLSDRYRKLENEDLAAAVLPVIQDLDLVIISAEVTERRFYLKAADRRIERDVPTGRRMGDGSHVFFDTVCPAVTISNSEVGWGSLSVETGVYTKACTNLAMIGRNLKKYHVGQRAALSDDAYALLSDRTKQLSDAAMWAQVRDLVTNGFAKSTFDALCERLTGATEDRIKIDPVVVVERTAKKFSLSEAIRSNVMTHLIEGADLTRYGLHAAITRASQDVKEYDTATEMERLGGAVIEMPRSTWRELAEV